MSRAPISSNRTIKVSVGPEIQIAGSWNWVGKDLIDSLNESQHFESFPFQNNLPECDVCVFVKWMPDLATLQELSKHSAIVFCPIDIYGSGAEIDADWERLRCCNRIIVHAVELEKYFRGYAKTTFLDHHLKFITSTRETFQESGPILWTGIWANLPPVVNWVNHFGLPDELVILTNFNGHQSRSPSDFGFKSSENIRIEEWSEEGHVEFLKTARTAIDIKGNDFRQRHKPPAKALDFISSGIPLAMNSDSGPVRYLRTIGFEIPEPDQTDYWFSREYWEKTHEFGLKMSSQLSRLRIMNQWREILLKSISEQGERCK